MATGAKQLCCLVTSSFLLLYSIHHYSCDDYQSNAMHSLECPFVKILLQFSCLSHFTSVNDGTTN